MILFWIGTAVLYGIIVIMVHRFFWNEVTEEESIKMDKKKFWLYPFYWQGALLIGLGIIALLFGILKWIDVLPF